MGRWSHRCLTSLAILAIQAGAAAQPSSPGPDHVVPARPAWRFEPARRCPGLRIAEGGAAAVVVFRVSAGGIPSSATLKTSSGSASLDAAAVACVMKLRFQPATNLGDGAFLDSWQQIALTSSRQPELPDGASGTSTLARPSHDEVPDANTKPENSSSQGRRVEVRVCADESGRLTQEPVITRSSGDPAFDAAAVRMAKALSGYYRPASGAGEKSAAGCIRLAINVEAD